MMFLKQYFNDDFFNLLTLIRKRICKQTAAVVLSTFFPFSDHMFKEMIKFMRYDKLIAEDELPAPPHENMENENVEVLVVGTFEIIHEIYAVVYN